MSSPTMNIVALVMDPATGAIGFERYMGNVPRLISCRLGTKTPTVAAYLKMRYDIEVTEYPERDFQVTPSVKVRFCSVVDNVEAIGLFQHKLWRMTLNELKGKLEFDYWGFPMKCQGIQKEIYAFETYLAGKFTDVASVHPDFKRQMDGDFIGEGGLPSN
mgnify:CR=1 FL=1